MTEDVTIVDCIEYGQISIDANLWLTTGHTTRFDSEIDGRDILRASFKNGVVTLQATSYVGVIPINDHVVVRVQPRVPIANLTRMVIDTGHDILPLRALRKYSGRGTADDWTMDIYVDALLDHIDAILDAGILRAYVRREAEGHFPHGRIDLRRTLQRFAAQGTPNKAAYSWFERTIDVPVNRCIKAAMEVVHSHLSRSRSRPRKGDVGRLARLAGQLHAFEEVSEDSSDWFLDDPEVLGTEPLPEHRSYYRPALDLSILILRDVGIALELGGDDVELNSLLVDTNSLFERFVRVNLAQQARQEGWPVDVLDGNTEGKVDLYDVPDPLPAPFGKPMPAAASREPGKAQPDVVFRALDGRFLLIAEVKNTVTSDASLPDRSHVEQAVTYALRYGLSFTLLVHPWTTGAKGLVYVGRVRSVDVYDYRLDLSSEAGTDGALADMATAAARLAGLT